MLNVYNNKNGYLSGIEPYIFSEHEKEALTFEFHHAVKHAEATESELNIPRESAKAIWKTYVEPIFQNLEPRLTHIEKIGLLRAFAKCIDRTCDSIFDRLPAEEKAAQLSKLRRNFFGFLHDAFPNDAKITEL